MTTALTGSPTTPGPVGKAEWSGAPLVAAFLLLILRVLLGGIFCFAAFLKLRDPQAFSEAIQAFRAVQSDQLVLMGTHILPWVEMFAGAALVLGVWTRPAALIFGLLLLTFIWAVIGAIGKGLAGIPCSCFGEWHLICTDGVGWCKVRENSGLTAIAGALVFAGGGKFSLDYLIERPPTR